MGDTHDVERHKVKAVVDDLIARGAEIIFHTGDIEIEHWDAKLFGDIPVVCALTIEQRHKPEFLFPPNGWTYTLAEYGTAARIINLGSLKIYLGHQRSRDLFLSFEKAQAFLMELETSLEGVEWIFSGHNHWQALRQFGPVMWVQPGAVKSLIPSSGYEFAFIDVDKKEVVFSRIPKVTSTVEPFTVGFISDPGLVSKRDSNFWSSVRYELDQRGARSLIISGLMPEDVGRTELSDIEVHYLVLPGEISPVSNLANWREILLDKPVVEISGYQFLVMHNLGSILAGKSEVQLVGIATEAIKSYHHIDMVVTGGYYDAMYEEVLNTSGSNPFSIINPGDAREKRRIAFAHYPREEMTLTRIRREKT